MAPLVLDAADPGAVERVAEVLSAGDLAVLPTDTVYGLAALPTVAGATARIFEAKERPDRQALAVLVADVEQAAEVADLDAAAHPDELAGLLADGWPGPLTVVVPRRGSAAALDLGGDPSTVGVRCPDHALVRAVAAAVGPLATTSANRHGAPTPETAEAAADLALVPCLVVDGGRLTARASTVIDATRPGWPVLRHGGYPEAGLDRFRPSG